MFNFYAKYKQNQENQNSLGNFGKTSKEIIDNFLKFAGDTTKKRSADFDILMRFVLDSDQWTNSELNFKEAEKDSALVFNFSQEYIERYMARLFPRNPQTGVLEIGVKISESDHAKNAKFEKEILDVYKDNDLANILIEQGIDYLCGGAGCFYYPLDPITKRASIYSIDPRKCYLGWDGNRLIQFAYKEYIGDSKYKTIYYDLTNIITHDERTDKYTVEKNAFNFIPLSWIPNAPKPHSHEGVPKTIILADLDRAYNRVASLFDKRIDENTEPPIVIKSDTITDVKKISRGRRKKTRIGSEDSMEYLELKEGKEILNWLSLIEQRMITKTGIVHSSGSVKTHISGKSLSFQYSDMMDLIGFMRLRWDKAFRELNTAILSYKYGVSIYQTDPIYQPFLIQDNSDRIEQYANMIESDLISHRDAIDELRGVENAEEKLKEILAEKKLFNEAEPVNNFGNNFNNNKE